MISSSRIIVSITFPSFVMYKAYKKNSLNKSGAISGFLVTFLLSLSNYCFLLDLMMFFISSSAATKFRQDVKAKLEENFKEGGQRSWVQVVCNGGVATCFALIYLYTEDTGENPVNFNNGYTASYLSLGIMSAFAFGNADTWASELGTVITKSEPRLITTWGKVPTGTNGGVTFAGTVLSTLGGLVVGLTHYVALICLANNNKLSLSPAQWPLIFYGAMAGLFGSLLDSLFGATLQFTGISKSGKIVSNPDMAVQHISGRNILRNSYVNLVTTGIIAIAVPAISARFWNF